MIEKYNFNDFLNFLLTEGEEEPIQAFLDQQVSITDEAALFRLMLSISIGEDFYLVDPDRKFFREAGFDGSFENNMNLSFIRKWLKTNLSDQECNYFYKAADILEMGLFFDYCDWWDSETYGWDDFANLEQYTFFNEEELDVLLDVLPHIQPYIKNNSLAIALLHLSMEELLEGGVLHFLERFGHKNAPQTLKNKQLNLVYEIAQILLSSQASKPIATELLAQYHFRIQPTDAKAIRKYWSQLPGSGKVSLIEFMVTFYIQEDNDVLLALKTWREVIHSQVQEYLNLNPNYNLWVEKEWTLFKHLHAKLSAIQMIDFAQLIGREFSQLIYFKLYVANQSTSSIKKTQLLTEILYELPKAFYFSRKYSEKYEICKEVDYRRSYHYELILEHLKVSIPLNPNPAYLQKLLLLVEDFNGESEELKELKTTLKRKLK